MYAIFKSGSKQYRVKKGDVIRVELLKQAPGDAVVFSDVLYVADAQGKVRVGAPVVSGCTVKAEYVNEVKGEKIHAVKYKRRKNQVRKFGHRQRYSEVKIVDITG